MPLKQVDFILPAPKLRLQALEPTDIRPHKIHRLALPKLRLDPIPVKPVPTYRMNSACGYSGWSRKGPTNQVGILEGML